MNIKYLSAIMLCCLWVTGCASEYYGSEQEYAPARGQSSGGEQRADVDTQRAETLDAYHLGMRYLLGQGVPVDYSKAYHWFKRSASDNNPYAENQLGYMYLSGKGVDQNYQEAFTWFKRSADHGLASAQYTLGLMYANGMGVAQDQAAAAVYFKQAAAQGFEPAKRAL